MKRLYFLLIPTMIFYFSSCSSNFGVSETIRLKTTTDIDVDYNKITSVVMKIDRQLMEKKLYEKYPDVIKNYVERVEIKTRKESGSLKKDINNVSYTNELSRISVLISMNYEKSKSEEAIQIIKFYKVLIIDELNKFDINLEKIPADTQ